MAIKKATISDRFKKIEPNGYVYETFGISKRFPFKLQQLLIRAETLAKPLTAKCFIHDVVLRFFFNRQSSLYNPVNKKKSTSWIS